MKIQKARVFGEGRRIFRVKGALIVADKKQIQAEEKAKYARFYMYCHTHS